MEARDEKKRDFGDYRDGLPFGLRLTQLPPLYPADELRERRKQYDYVGFDAKHIEIDARATNGNYLRVQKVEPDSWASTKTSIQKDDILLAINGSPVDVMSHAEFLLALRARPNRMTFVRFLKKGVKPPRDKYVDVIRYARH